MNKIVLMPNLPAKVQAIARELLPSGFQLTVAPDGASDARVAAAALRDADFFLGFITRPQPPVFYEALATTKLVQLLSAGYDKVDIESLRSSQVPVSTNGGANAVAVAEHTVMLMLAVLKRAADLSSRVKSGGWTQGGIGQAQVYELEGKTVGLLGLGMIGRQVAKRVRAFDARVIYYDVYRLHPDQEEALGVEYVPLEELVRTSDVLSLHVPLTDETRGLMNEHRLADMKPGSVLINTCRGEVVDEHALCDALQAGHLLGAGLDTLEVEPPPADHALFKLSNVIITPHTAGPTWDSWQKRFRNSYQNILRVSQGESPLWVIPELRETCLK